MKSKIQEFYVIYNSPQCNNTYMGLYIYSVKFYPTNILHKPSSDNLIKPVMAALKQLQFSHYIGFFIVMVIIMV